MKVLLPLRYEEVDQFMASHVRSVERFAQIHNSIVSREGAIAAILDITERPDEYGESVIWVTLSDCYMQLRMFNNNGEWSKWMSAENWERNPWFP